MHASTYAPKAALEDELTSEAPSGSGLCWGEGRDPGAPNGEEGLW